MKIETLRAALLQTCEEYLLPEDLAAVIEEPYVPYVPEPWNGLLVLAEAQNMSAKNAAYVAQVQQMDAWQRLTRLDEARKREDRLRIQPWDDGSLPLAVESAFDLRAEATAVSNAVMWSVRDAKGNNQNPSNRLIAESIKLWKKMLAVLQPKLIVTAGKIAEKVVQGTDVACPRHCLRSSSPLALSRIAGMFREDDLLRRYPEVAAVAARHPEWLAKFQLNKVIFACHAVSVAGNKPD
jgi:hypothetical protein